MSVRFPRSNHRSFNEDTFQIKINCLKNFVQAFLTEVETLEKTGDSRSSGIRLREEVRRFEISLISCALEQTRGNQTLAAILLGTKVTTLNSKIRSYGIPVRGGGFGKIMGS